MDKILRPWRLYASFKGRSTRTEFWLFFLLFYLVLFALCALPLAVFGLSAFGEPGSDPDPQLLYSLIPAGLFFVAAMLPSLALGARRLHDSDKSGWMYLLTMAPYIGFLFFIVFGFMRPTRGDNRFGDDPRGGGNLAPASVNQIFG